MWCAFDKNDVYLSKDKSVKKYTMTSVECELPLDFNLLLNEIREYMRSKHTLPSCFCNRSSSEILLK
jgi:hypothetical protein